MNDKKKPKPEPEPLIISDFQQAQEIAAPLIKNYHSHLASANIIYLCRSRATKQGGKKVFGYVKKASPIERHISMRTIGRDSGYFDQGEEADFIMVIAIDVWNNSHNHQRTAMIDHLLTRCQGEEDPKNGNMKYSLRPPMIQEFNEIAERHGLWNESLAEFAGCIKK